MKKLTFMLFALMAGATLLTTSCQKDEIDEYEILEKAAKVKPDRTKPKPGEPQPGDGIGNLKNGGIIFWVNPVTDAPIKGLVCALEDAEIYRSVGKGNRTIRSGAIWGCENITAGATGKAILTGQENTDAIINVAGCDIVETAAKYCDDYVLGDNTEWFLPSEGELLEMYNVLHKNGIGNFKESGYWSSTEVNDKHAFGYFFFTNGYDGPFRTDEDAVGGKEFRAWVRPISAY